MNFLKSFFVKKKIKKAFDKSEQNIITNRENLRCNSRTIHLHNLQSICVTTGLNNTTYSRFSYKNIKEAFIVLIED